MSFVLKVDDTLSLRLVEPYHAEEMFAVADANREHIARWMPWLTPSYSVDDTRALTTLAIQEYGIRRLTIRAEPGNERSWRIPERLGYVYEGTIRDSFRVDGRRVDHKLYSMLAEEWTP